MRTIELHFASGKAFLSEYWKDLPIGGLVVHEKGLVEGQSVVLGVTLGRQRYQLPGRVASGIGDGQLDDCAIVTCATLSGQAGGVMPWRPKGVAPRTVRRSLREPAEQAVAVWGVTEPACVTTGRLLNLSSGGCRITYDDDAHSVGDTVFIRGYDFDEQAIVRWRDGVSIGLQFKYLH